jgi:ABC-type methionine transport system ATPase subunit
MKSRLFLTFPQRILGEPLLYTLGREFQVVPNIQGASITKDRGIMALELTGEDAEVSRAIDYLKSKGVQVEVLPADRDAPIP